MNTSPAKLVSLFLACLVFQLSGPLFAAGSSTKSPDKDATEKRKEAISLYNEGTERLFAGEFGQGEMLLRKAIQKDNDLAEAYNNLAFALRKQGAGKFKEALKHYNRAILMDSKLAEARMYRGVLYVAMGEGALAKKDHAWLEANSPRLAEELAWVIANGKEKEPAQFFGVANKR